MAPDRLRAALQSAPFRRFTVEIPGGKKVTIEHPDYTSLSPSGRTLIVYGYPEDDSMEIIDVFVSNLSYEASKAVRRK